MSKRLNDIKVVIDPGHGGPDPGAVNNTLNLREKDIALKIAKRLQGYLQNFGIQTVLTRDTDKHVSLRERCDIANYHKADLFVSIHLNGAENKTAKGFEVYHYAGSAKGKELAEAIMKSLDQLGWGLYPGYVKRGVKTADYYVLKHTNMPAVLCECGFITNDEEAKWVNENADYVALRIHEGILDYLKQQGVEIKVDD